MALYFLDTSALAKLYVREPGTEKMLELADGGDSCQLALLSITPVEVRSAIRRRERSGDIGATEAEHILALFAIHLSNVFLRQPVTERLLEVAMRLVDDYGLRAYDAMQLAGCIMLKESTPETAFVCADAALNTAARSENLATIDPTE